MIGNDYLQMQHKRIEESLRQAKEIQDARLKLEETKSEIRKHKIDILKNGSRKDKINLLIQERLQQLEDEESISPCNINSEISMQMEECMCKH